MSDSTTEEIAISRKDTTRQENTESEDDIPYCKEMMTPMSDSTTEEDRKNDIEHVDGHVTETAKHEELSESRIGEADKVSVQLNYIMEDVHGATIVAEELFGIKGSDEQFFEWNECGFSLHVPEGALLATETCPIVVKALVAGNFQFPKHTQLISGLYALSAAREFRKPVQTTMEHCLKLERKTQLERMHFVKAHQTQKGMPYIFEIEPGGNFEINSQFGSLWQHSFSICGIVIEDEVLPVPVDDESTSSSDQNDHDDDEDEQSEDDSTDSTDNDIDPSDVHVYENNSVIYNVDTEETTKTTHSEEMTTPMSDSTTQEIAISHKDTTRQENTESDVILYNALTFYEKIKLNNYSHKFVAIQSLEIQYKFVNESPIFSSMKLNSRFSFHFKNRPEPCLTLDFKEDRKYGNGWHVYPDVSPSLITKKEINLLPKKEPTENIPFCSTNVYADAGTTDNLEYPIVIEGIEPPRTINIVRHIDDQVEQTLLVSQQRESFSNRRVELNEVFKLLKEKSSKWDSIGGALGISFDFREGLRLNQALENPKRLEIVLEKWIQSKCSEVSWSQLIKVLKDLQLHKLAQEVLEYLNTPKCQNPISGRKHSFKSHLATNSVYYIAILFVLLGILYFHIVDYLKNMF